MASIHTQMRQLAEKIILHGIDHWPENSESEDAIFNRKISILHMDQGVELVLKAYLLQSGYLIHRIMQKKVKKGLKSGARIDGFLDENKTLEFEDARQLCKKLLKACARKQHTTRYSIQLNGLAELHKKRNEIQHFGVGVRGKTTGLISSALSDLVEIYELTEFEAEGFVERVEDFINKIRDSYFENP